MNSTEEVEAEAQAERVVRGLIDETIKGNIKWEFQVDYDNSIIGRPLRGKLSEGLVIYSHFLRDESPDIFVYKKEPVLAQLDTGELVTEPAALFYSQGPAARYFRSFLDLIRGVV